MKETYYELQFQYSDKTEWQTWDDYKLEDTKALIKSQNMLIDSKHKVRIMVVTKEEVTWGL